MMEGLRNQVLSSIEPKLNSLTELSPNCCIYRVPENLRKVKKDAYRPLIVSVGPFYYRDSKLQAMKEQKLRYLSYFLHRNTDVGLGTYLDFITLREQEARHCYAKNVDLPSTIFVEMVLVDAAFIIELLLRDCVDQYIAETDRIFNKPRMIMEVIRDIRLEENQLPFFILRGLYDFAFPTSSPNRHLSFVNLSYRFFTKRNEPVPRGIDAPREVEVANIKHLVDFLRLCYLPSRRRELPTGNNAVAIFLGVIEPSGRELPTGNRTHVIPPSVSELSEAGVKFKVKNTLDLLDIGYKDGVLEIPRLMATDYTESLFRNIMVFEHCHCYLDSYIIDYFAFLNGLINTPKDVEILVQNGIIDNWLGSKEEVADFFNKIFKQTRLQAANFYYSGVCEDLNAYASTSWHRWNAILKRNYFNHPWAVISVIYAIVILILTAIQAGTGFGKK